MIIINLNGGLGNQMFQYAFGIALAQKYHTKLYVYTEELNRKKIHNGYELENVFNLNINVANEDNLKKVLGIYSHKLMIKLFKSKKLQFLRPKHYVVESIFNYNHKQYLNIQNNSFIRGFWQSEKYFQDYRAIIRSKFEFNKNISIENSKTIDYINTFKTSVSMHIRKGDYISNKGAANTFEVLNEEYYSNAIKLLNLDKENCLIVLFSDDPSWTKKHIADKILNGYTHYIVSNNNGVESYNDMRLMSLCTHNIIANSSFSWWGAWLNNNQNKIVIAPKKWFKSDKDSSDLIPSSWIRI